MSRDQAPGPEEPPEPPPSGRVRTTAPGALLATGLVALVLGWAVRPTALALDLSAPRVSWVQVGVLYLVAGILVLMARATQRAVAGRQPLRAHEAVNRLVLAKACALAGAAVAGGYLGFAFSWVGIDAELAGERMLRAVIAAVGGLLVVAAALLLERACRVRPDGPAS